MKNLRNFALVATLGLPFGVQASWSTDYIAGMNVQLYKPSTSSVAGSGRALMINLHGCTQSATDLQIGGNWQKTADKYGMVIALPDLPNGGVGFGCWDYYGEDHTRTNRHNKHLIELAQALKARSELGTAPWPRATTISMPP
jgi:poly(3-hydroxybutyrate) depolymerase